MFYSIKMGFSFLKKKKKSSSKFADDAPDGSEEPTGKKGVSNYYSIIIQVLYFCELKEIY